MSESFRPAFSTTAWIAGTGPMPMISGGTPAAAPATSRASGALPWLLRVVADAASAAAAPSTMADELPPVCTPPKAGRIFASCSTRDGRMWVSWSSSFVSRDSLMPRAL